MGGPPALVLEKKDSIISITGEHEITKPTETDSDETGSLAKLMAYLEKTYSSSTLGRGFAVINALFQAMLNFSGNQIKSKVFLLISRFTR